MGGEPMTFGGARSGPRAKRISVTIFSGRSSVLSEMGDNHRDNQRETAEGKKYLSQLRRPDSVVCLDLPSPEVVEFSHEN